MWPSQPSEHGGPPRLWGRPQGPPPTPTRHRQHDWGLSLNPRLCLPQPPQMPSPPALTRFLVLPSAREHHPGRSFVLAIHPALGGNAEVLAHHHLCPEHLHGSFQPVPISTPAPFPTTGSSGKSSSGSDSLLASLLLAATCHPGLLQSLNCPHLSCCGATTAAVLSVRKPLSPPLYPATSCLQLCREDVNDGPTLTI